MAFAGAATGAPAQSEQSAVTQVTSPTGEKLQVQKMGIAALSPVGGKAVEKNPYKAVKQGNAKGGLLAASTDRNVPKVQKAAALSYKAPSGVNATAAATVDQPVTLKNPAVLSKTGVNGWQQDTFGGYNLEPPDPSLCAGAGFVVQVVNSQVQISDANLNKLTAPIPMESFFGDFANSLFDPLCSYNHSTGRFYMTEAVSDFATFSGVYIAVSTSSDPRGTWNIYILDLGTFGGDGGCALGLCLADQPNLGSDQYTISISTNQFGLTGAECVSGFVALRTSSSTRSRWRMGHRSRTPSGSTSRTPRPSRRTSTSMTASPASDRAGTRSSRRTQPTAATTRGPVARSGR